MIQRRRFLIALPALAAVGTARASGLEKLRALYEQVVPPPKVTGTLLDVSGSIRPEEEAIYRLAMSQEVTALQRGQRIVLAEISERLQPQFRLAFDLRAPDTGRSRFDNAVATAKAREAMTLFEQLASKKKRASRSCIVDAISGMAEVLAAAPERTKSILILTDAIEDSPTLGSFDRPRLKKTDVPGVVARAKSAGLARDLSGVQVRMVGAGGRDAVHYEAVKSFWHAWLQDTCGARISHYGRVPPPVAAG